MRPAWKALAAHHEKVERVHLRQLFADDPKRGERMTAEAAGVYLDYSKNRITDETLRLLFQLAAESGLRARIDAMFRGDRINVTEQRAVLHVALRAPRGASIVVDGENVVDQVHSVLARMVDFAIGSEWRLDGVPGSWVIQNGATDMEALGGHVVLVDGPWNSALFHALSRATGGPWLGR